MKTNVIKTMAIIATLMFCGLPQNAFSQENNNKVKKVDYLGHKYKGQVNADKIPDGKGYITIGDFYIAGSFEGSTVSEATVSKTHGDGADFLGTIKFDTSNQIELKAGGVYVIPYRNIYHTKDRLETRDTLSQDKIVDSNSFEPKSASVTRVMFFSEISSKLIPPSTCYIKVPLRKGEYTIYGSPEKHIGFIEDDCMDERRDVNNEPLTINNFKDNQGRIWDYNRHERDYGSSAVVVSYKVTYPDGSYYSHKDGQYDEWKIYYPDGKSLTSQGALTIPEGNLYINYPQDWNSADDFMKWNSSKTIPKKSSRNYDLSFVCKNNDFSSMSNDAIVSFVKEKLMPYIDANDYSKITLKNQIGIAGVYYYENDKYVSEIDRKKEADAKEAADVKAYQAEIASFTKRFGFNPVGKKVGQLITVGRSFKLLREWNAYVASHYALLYSYMRFNLSIDHGNSKCYDMILDDMKKVGYIWVRGDKVSSVVWY